MRYPLIYNEREEAEKIYKSGFTNGFSKREALLVAKYFRHILGYGDARVKTEIRNFSEKNDRFFHGDRKINRDSVKQIVSESKAEFVDNTNGVCITDAEISRIKEIGKYADKKLLFTMLVLSKLNEGKVIIAKWKNIRETIPSRITNKEIWERVARFCKDGLFEIHGYYHKELFSRGDSYPTISINATNIYNLGKVFEEFFGKDIFECVSCGMMSERRSHNQKRCSKCAKEKRKEVWRDIWHRKKTHHTNVKKING